MMNCYSMTTRWEFGHKVENPNYVRMGDNPRRECQWQHVCLRDTPRYERQWRHPCCVAFKHIHWVPCTFPRWCCRVFIFTHTCTLAQVWVFHTISMAIHVCAVSSPWSSLSTSCSTFHPFSSSSTTWSLWKTCTTPAMRVWTPLTTSSSPQVMSPRPMTSTRPQSSALLQQSLFCGPRLRWRYTRRHAPSSTSSASLPLFTRRLVCQSVVVVNVR